MWRRRSLWVAAAAVLYVCAAALQEHPESPAAWLALVLGPLLLVIGFSAIEAPGGRVDHIDANARSAARVTIAGMSIAVTAALGVGLQLAEALGVALASVSSLVALVRVSSLGGVAARPSRYRYDAAVLAGLLWVAALALSAARVFTPHRLDAVDPFIVDYATVAASLAVMGIALVAAFRLYAQRRFELGVAERAAAALWLTILALVIGVFAALLSVAAPERIVPLMALCGAVAVSASAVSLKPSRISSLLRMAVAVTLLCAPVVCVAVVVAYKAPTHAGLILFVVTILAAVLGVVAPRLAHWLAPERGKWISVLEAAIRAAKEPDPRQAVVNVLSAVRDGLGADEGPAAVYRIASNDRVVVDRAGYLHVEPGELPARLIDVASAEPDQVLSSESLRYIQVQRPDVRDLVAWLDTRGAGATALIRDDDVFVGALVWPSAGRASPLSFQEVSLLRHLADHLGAATESAAQLARARSREIEAEQAMHEAVQRASELETALAKQLRKHEALAEHLARPARVASYSGAARSALTDAERHARSGLAVALVAPPGVDAVSWAAVIHLASPYRDGPLMVIAAPSDIERRLQGAPGGTLVVLEAHTFPVEAQHQLAAVQETGVIAVVPSLEKLDERLADRLGERAVMLPALIDRPEDLRALALDHLARIGMRLRGSPMGLSLQAQEMLNEHDWPGNDVELEAVLTRAAVEARDEVVQADELARLIGVSQPTREGRRVRRAR
jgi:GAF domain-containing protein